MATNTDDKPDDLTDDYVAIAPKIYARRRDDGALDISTPEREIRLDDVERMRLLRVLVAAAPPAPPTPPADLSVGPRVLAAEHRLTELALRVDHIAAARDRDAAVIALSDRMNSQEQTQQNQYKYLCDRLNRTDDNVSTQNRLQNQQHAALSMAISGGPEGDGVQPQLAQLVMVVDGLATTVDQLQALVATATSTPPAPPSAAPPFSDNLATREYVDAGLRRLSAALREHIAQVFTDAVRLSAPGPGLVARLVQAVRPAPRGAGAPPASAQRMEHLRQQAVDPTRAGANGAAAARAEAREP